MKEIKVGLIGFGTVGKGLAEVLLSQRERLTKRTGMAIRLVGVADRSTTTLPERFKDIPLTTDGMELINNPDIDIIVELIG
jgi:homoserine dehydrogenase